MNCSKVQTLLSAYLDREVSGHEMLAIRDHLRSCECCRDEEEALRTVKSMLCGASIVEPDAGFEDRLCAAVRNSVAPHERSSAKKPGVLARILGPNLARFSVSRPFYAYATVGLTAFSVALGALVIARPDRSDRGHSGSPLSGVDGSIAASKQAGPDFTSLIPFNAGQAKIASTKLADPKESVNSKMTGKRFLELLDRDHAYISSADPLSGPQVALSASYGSR